MPFIDPKPTESNRYVEWNRKNDISHSAGGFPPERDDVGIVPYIPAGLHTIQPGASKPSGFGRLVAAPTGVLGCIPFNGGRG